MSDKPNAIASLRDEFNRWEALLAGLSEAQITEPLPSSDWSIKDTVAHLRAWQQVSIARMEAALHDAQPVMPDWLAGADPESEARREEFNAAIYQTYRDLPWQRVHHLWRDGFLRLIALSEQAPEHDLLAVNKFAWIKGYALIAVLEGSLAHHREHRESLLAEMQVVEQREKSMYGLIGKIRSTPGQRDALIAILLNGVSEMPGCLSYIVARDPSDADAIWITEVWDSQESHAASLSLPSVQRAIAKARPLIAGFGERFETQPVGAV